MKAKWLMLVCLLVVVLVVAGCVPAKAPTTETAVPTEYKSIRMVGPSLGSAACTAIMGQSLVLNKYFPEIEWSSSSGSISTNAIYLTKGTIKIGQASATAYIDAYGFDKIAESSLRSITSNIPPPNFLFVIPQDKPWNDITEVPRGVTLCPGTAGTTGLLICEAWLNLCGLSKKDFNWLPLGKQEQADQWRVGKLDVVFLPVTGMAPYLMDMYLSPRKFKPMGLTPEQAARAKAEKTFERMGSEAPARSIVTELVPELFKNEVIAVQQAFLLSARDDFPDEIAYKMAKVLDEHQAELAQIYATLKYAAPRYHIQLARLPLDIHPGVAKYYREKGYLK